MLRKCSSSTAKARQKDLFGPRNFVSVRIPRINYASTDHHRLPCVVLECHGKVQHLHRLR